MHISDFDYELPHNLIAQSPIEPRDAARLLVDQGSKRPLHSHVRDIANFFEHGDVLVVNNTRVLPARLQLRRETGGAVEVLLLEAKNSERTVWEALLRPGGKLRPGEQLIGRDDDDVLRPLLEVGERTPAGDTFFVTMLAGNVLSLLSRIGEMPLPPYIHEKLRDAERYQTVYSKNPGSAAAPTAGLHFTTELLESIVARGVEIANVELVVGLDTFAPVSVEDPLDHVIHTESYTVPEATIELCQQANRVIAVGTTATRALETAATTGHLVGRSDLFITPGYDFKLVDMMMTNFHMPRTTLLLMIEAFVGRRWLDLYAVAVREKYRFLSFGDAMLLDRSLR